MSMTDGANAEDKKIPKLSRIDAAAVLLMSLGEGDAAQILKHMGPKEVQRVGSSMAALKDITQDQVEGVMIEFLESVGTQTGLGIGSDEYIKNMLTEALGQDKADSLIDRILVGGNTTGLDTLKWMDGREKSARRGQELLSFFTPLHLFNGSKFG